jgi:hypothetical protein
MRLQERMHIKSWGKASLSCGNVRGNIVAPDNSLSLPVLRQLLTKRRDESLRLFCRLHSGQPGKPMRVNFDFAFCGEALDTSALGEQTERFPGNSSFWCEFWRLGSEKAALSMAWKSLNL